MGLSSKRPSRGDQARARLMKDVTDGGSGKKKRLNADIEESLYKRIKIRAVEEGRSISDMTRDLWTEYLGD